MPASTRRRTSAGPTAAAKAKPKGQATLAFHGHTNKVTKPVAQVGKAKKELVPTEKAEVIEIEEEEPTTAESSIIEQAETEAKAPLTTEEEQAQSVSEAQIKKFWLAKEKARLAPRVHQEGLSLHEKVCRDFDVDGRYGPCMGIARIKRWKRAQMLGMNPAIEVLAILLQEEKAKNIKAQWSHMDELMNSKFADV